MDDIYTVIIHSTWTDFDKQWSIPHNTVVCKETFCRVLAPKISDNPDTTSYIMMKCTWLKGLSEDILAVIIKTIPDVACLYVNLTSKEFKQWYIDENTEALAQKPLTINTEYSTIDSDVILYSHNGYGGKGTGFTWATTARRVFEPYIALSGLTIAFKQCYEIGCISSTSGYVRLYDKIYSHEELKCHLEHNFDDVTPVKLRTISYSTWLERATHEAFEQHNYLKVSNRLAEWINQRHMLDWHYTDSKILLSYVKDSDDIDSIRQELVDILRVATNCSAAWEEPYLWEITTNVETVDGVTIQQIIITLK